MSVVTVRVVDSIVDHARGAELTVQVTTTVRRRVRLGYYEVVAGSLDPSAADDALEPEVVGAPAGNASTDEWLAFLRVQNITVPVDDDGDTPGREALKAIWQKAHGEG